VQGTAEGEPVERKEVDAMVDLALAGIQALARRQREALEEGGIDLSRLTAE
jgi:ribonuclease PH